MIENEEDKDDLIDKSKSVNTRMPTIYYTSEKENVNHI